MESPTSPFRLLLLDGDSGWSPDFWQVFEQIVGRPLQTAFHADLEEALKEIAEGAWDAIVLGLRDGRMSAPDLLGRIREIPGRPPVLVVGERHQRGEDLECMAAGATGFLIQSELTPDALDRALRYALAHTRSTRQLEEALNLRDHFLSLLAHDVRGPLAVLASGLELYANRFRGLPQDKVEKFLRQAELQTRQMQALTTQVLDWANSQSPDFHPYRTIFTFQESFDSVLQTLKPLADGKTITIENGVAPDTGLRVDRNMWETILRNLLSNAVKFSGPGSPIKVGADKTHGQFRVTVQDRGIGMSKAQCRNLLAGRGVEVRRGTDNETGTGLGIQLCMRFAELHGGALEIKSAVNQGTRVTVVLPANCFAGAGQTA